MYGVHIAKKKPIARNVIKSLSVKSNRLGFVRFTHHIVFKLSVITLYKIADIQICQGKIFDKFVLCWNFMCKSSGTLYFQELLARPVRIKMIYDKNVKKRHEIK